MKESATAALSYVKGHVWRWDGEVPEDWFRTHDLHVHVPAGAVPKDGPSAGITMATAIVSLVTGRPVRSDVAMTGEITLTGQVLPIGGLKEKSLAAQRAGVTHVIAPKLNEADLDDFPESLTGEVEFTFVDRIDQVLEHGLEEPKTRASRARRPRPVASERAAARAR
jgi:ATP-dependent Lon protease